MWLKVTEEEAKNNPLWYKFAWGRVTTVLYLLVVIMVMQTVFTNYMDTPISVTEVIVNLQGTDKIVYNKLLNYLTYLYVVLSISLIIPAILFILYKGNYFIHCISTHCILLLIALIHSLMYKNDYVDITDFMDYLPSLVIYLISYLSVYLVSEYNETFRLQTRLEIKKPLSW